nr:MAG TPA: hypothetical protein [Crassvirales sp.]
MCSCNLTYIVAILVVLGTISLLFVDTNPTSDPLLFNLMGERLTHH